MTGDAERKSAHLAEPPPLHVLGSRSTSRSGGLGLVALQRDARRARWMHDDCAHADPLHVLREYRTLRLELAGSLDSGGRGARRVGGHAINAAAKAAPSERTIRFYVTRGW